jgi:hypothetical protein
MEIFKLAKGLSYFTRFIPQILGWGTTLLALAGLVLTAGTTLRSPYGRFWICWLVSCFAYKVAMPTSLEIRHLFLALPAMAGLASGLFDRRAPRLITRGVAPALLVLALALNVFYLVRIPSGLVGYQEVAAELAAQSEPGNVLLACPYNSELMFCYRALVPRSGRTMIRADRTLAIRLSAYANVPTEVLGHEPDDVLSVILQGRIRYIVTSEPQSPAGDDWTGEIRLTHETVSSRPEAFTLIGKFPLGIDFESGDHRWQTYLWVYRNKLPGGPDELPVVVPTARMVLTPKS